MANVDAPLGLRLHNYPGGAEADIRSRIITSGQTIYPGDPIEEASGKVHSTAGTTDDANTIGVAVGYGVGSAALEQVLYVANPEACFFRIQCDGAVAVTDVGRYAQTTAVTGSTVTKRSQSELDYSSIEDKGDFTAGCVWRIVDILRSPHNTAGSANAEVIVQLDLMGNIGHSAP